MVQVLDVGFIGFIRNKIKLLTITQFMLIKYLLGSVRRRIESVIFEINVKAAVRKTEENGRGSVKVQEGQYMWNFLTDLDPN